VEAVPSKAQILQSIKDFLAESSTAKPRQCQHCGTALHFIDTHFRLRGTAINWNVPLPFCPACDPEILEDLPGPETIH